VIEAEILENSAADDDRCTLPDSRFAQAKERHNLRQRWQQSVEALKA
jgi:hypothetical protein